MKRVNWLNDLLTCKPNEESTNFTKCVLVLISITSSFSEAAYKSPSCSKL